MINIRLKKQYVHHIRTFVHEALFHEKANVPNIVFDLNSTYAIINYDNYEITHVNKDFDKLVKELEQINTQLQQRYGGKLGNI